jgi:hypothetical protein
VFGGCGWGMMVVVYVEVTIHVRASQLQLQHTAPKT